MKTKLIIALFALIARTLYSQVGVNILTPHPSAALQVESPAGSMRGMLTPSMTTTNRMSIFSGTNTASDGLVVYDINHRMHYYYNAGTGRWVSMSPLVLSTNTTGAGPSPSGVITTPPSASSFSVGINIQNPTAQLHVQGNARISASLTAGNVVVNNNLSVPGFPLNSLVPAGTIVMWYGSSIPSGWTECDGTSGSPDLRGRFIVSAGQAGGTPVPGDYNPNYVMGNTGGENTHRLSKAEIPKHSHLASGDGASISASGGSHSHGVGGIDGTTSVGGGSAKDVIPTNAVSRNSDNAAHTHNTSDFSGATGDGSASGLNGQSHENRPQYFVLRFIMKL